MSASVGASNRGRLKAPARLRPDGLGYVIPETWRERGNSFGTDELVDAVARVGRILHDENPGVRLGVADLSPPRGGRSAYHRSHQSGRDVDLLFLSVDADGKALPPPRHEMIHYNANGRAYRPLRRDYDDKHWKKRHFDLAGNWQVIEALLTDPQIRVQWVFVSNALRKSLLKHAEQTGKPAWLIEYAGSVLRQPKGVPPHDDHFHVRIYCQRKDRQAGCSDNGPVWHHEKKAMKYGTSTERYDPVTTRGFIAAAYLRPPF